MTEFESPLGRQSFKSGQRRVFTVNDPNQEQLRHNLNVRSEHFQQVEQEQPLMELTREEAERFEAARSEAYRSRNVVSQNARERIEFLTGIGRIKSNFELEGKMFCLQSLKSGEFEDVLEAMLQLGDTTQGKYNFEIRRQILARSLVSVDGLLIEEIIGSDELEAKLDLIRHLDENLVSFMYLHYEKEIAEKSKKYLIKNQQDVEEVVEAIKK